MLYIIRHGQTASNKAKKLQGRSDLPLNENGIAQAEEAGKAFAGQGIAFDKVYSSPLQRAVATARIVLDQIGGDEAGAGESCRPEIVIDDRLLEMDYGPYEGMDLENPAPEVMEFFMDFAGTPAPEGMEQLDSVVSRLGDFLEDIREEAMTKNILLSTHAIAMKGALEYLTPESGGDYWSKYIGNCAVYVSDTEGDEYGVPYEIGAE